MSPLRRLAGLITLTVLPAAAAAVAAASRAAAEKVASGSSALSRNYQVGARLAAGERLDEIVESMVQTAEGVNTAPVIHERARELGCEMPITNAVYAILRGDTTPADP